LRLNGHLEYLGKALADGGLSLSRSVEVPDNRKEIEEVLEEVWARSDLVITTGGLGPTVDDITRETIAEVMGVALVSNETIEAELRQFFEKRGRIPTTNNFKQCEILEGAVVLPNPNGTAPGQWFEANGKILVMLPGPPRELQPMFESEVVPRLEAKGWLRTVRPYRAFRTMGIGESQLEETIKEVLRPVDSAVETAFCAHEGMVDVRLKAHDSSVISDDELDQWVIACEQALGADYVGEGEPDPACLVIHQLRALGSKLAIAESCTGGLLASRFTDVCGASKVLSGGIVCYTNEIKEHHLKIPHCLLEQHGAVSAECAVAMAAEVADKFEADYALSVTGYAGPDGGKEPAGTIYIGISTPVGVWSHKLICSGTRTAVKIRAVNGAIDLLRRKLRKFEVAELLDRWRC